MQLGDPFGGEGTAMHRKSAQNKRSRTCRRLKAWTAALPNARSGAAVHRPAASALAPCGPPALPASLKTQAPALPLRGRTGGPRYNNVAADEDVDE